MNDGGYDSTACPDCVVTRCQVAGATAGENQLNEPDSGLLAEWEAAEADCGATIKTNTAKTADAIPATTRRPRPARERTRSHDSRCILLLLSWLVKCLWPVAASTRAPTLLIRRTTPSGCPATSWGKRNGSHGRHGRHGRRHSIRLPNHATSERKMSPDAGTVTESGTIALGGGQLEPP
jgi:hypothetical protein